MKYFDISAYSDGIAKEARVMNYLASIGYEVRASSNYENTRLDIDCYINGTPTSIKTMHNHKRFDNIGFEMWQFVDNQWQPSGWFFKGQAEQYVVWHKTGNIVRYDKEAIVRLIKQGVLTTGYKCQLREETCVSQAAIGHTVIDAESYYVDIAELIGHGAAVIIGHLPFEGQVSFSMKPKLRKKENVPQNSVR